jgi:chromosome condensin MukBEF complex kleisin-like MukF subunit
LQVDLEKKMVIDIKMQKIKEQFEILLNDEWQKLKMAHCQMLYDGLKEQLKNEVL